MEFQPGYPVDRRTDAQRLRMANSQPGDLEFAAARVVARCTGAEVTIQDDNSARGMADLRVDRPGLPSAYVEVVTDLDKRHGQLTQAVRERHHQLPCSTLRMTWSVTLSDRSLLKQLDVDLEPALAQVEQAGLLRGEQRSLSDDELADRPELDRLRRLGVVEAGSWPLGEDPPDKIHIQAVGGRYPVNFTWEDALRELRVVLAGPALADVRAKLQRTGADEKHIFLYLSHTSPPNAYAMLTRRPTEIPPAAPTLPAEITHLWLWTTNHLGHCLAWFPGRGWFEPAQHWATA